VSVIAVDKVRHCEHEGLSQNHVRLSQQVSRSRTPSSGTRSRADVPARQALWRLEIELAVHEPAVVLRSSCICVGTCSKGMFMLIAPLSFCASNPLSTARDKGVRHVYYRCDWPESSGQKKILSQPVHFTVYDAKPLHSASMSYLHLPLQYFRFVAFIGHHAPIISMRAGRHIPGNTHILLL
jgi:hypothetical protein